MTERRNPLTDEDVIKIAEELERRLLLRFYTNLGKGFWALAWKGVMLVLMSVAAYGAFKGVK